MLPFPACCATPRVVGVDLSIRECEKLPRPIILMLSYLEFIIDRSIFDRLYICAIAFRSFD
jgi:hypothetical protein